MKTILETTQHIYACFGKGDVPGILEVLADNVQFKPGGDPKTVPFVRTYNGKKEVEQFFQLLAANARTTAFVPSNFKVSGHVVTNDLHYEAVAIPTGKAYTLNVRFTWDFDDKGKATRWVSSGDFSAQDAAFVVMAKARH
jgi:ketosteroid isomerase-like protein